MRSISRLVLPTLLAFFALLAGANAEYLNSVISSFNAPPANPGYGKLTDDGAGYYWGATQAGGTYGLGTIFKVKKDGTGWQTVLSFTGGSGASQGAVPNGDLLLDGGYFWGTTQRTDNSYDANDNGTVFKINASTGVLSTVAFFDGTNGANPGAGLVKDNQETPYYWGTTQNGGANGDGVVFNINSSTGALTTPIHFDGDQTIKGSAPLGKLVLDTTTGIGLLIGTASQGGDAGDGVVFRVIVSNAFYTCLGSFQGPGVSLPGPNGENPVGEVVYDPDDGLYYGTTQNGGQGGGTVFRIAIGGGAFGTYAELPIASFSDGIEPTGGLYFDGTKFWGSAAYGGGQFAGAIFTCTHGSSPTVTTVAQFQVTDGALGSVPESGLVSDGTSLWGTTFYGGQAGNGTVFKVNMTTLAATTVTQFANDAAAVNHGSNPDGGLADDGSGFLWGTTTFGGSGNFGTIYKVNKTTGALTTLIEFTGQSGACLGSQPLATLVTDGAGYFWGATVAGGAENDSGTIFKINQSTGAFETIYVFAGDDGAHPSATLVDDGAGNYWGTTYSGGSSGNGTVYKINRSGTPTVATMWNFSGTDGSSPEAPLASDGAGNFWGTTTSDSIGSHGTVFKINTSGTPTLTTVYRFLGGNDGNLPFAGLVYQAPYMWGVTYQGGSSGYGTVFKVDTATNSFSTVFGFTGTSGAYLGAYPQATLVADTQGYLWGTTQNGAAFDSGSVFNINVNSGAMNTVVQFSGTGASASTGQQPTSASLLRDAINGDFYGTTRVGGPFGGGTIFKLFPVSFTPLQTWRQTYYGTTANEGDAADTADPYHTGIPNLLVFALLGPNQDPATASPGQLPQLQTSSSGVSFGLRLSFDFYQPSGVAGVTYGAEWSPTALDGSWNPIRESGGGLHHIFGDYGGNYPTFFIRLTVSVP